jgi:hypothetical protein
MHIEAHCDSVHDFRLGGYSQTDVSLNRCRNGQQRCARGVADCEPANPWRVLIMQLSRWESARSRWDLETGRNASSTQEFGD